MRFVCHVKTLWAKSEISFERTVAKIIKENDVRIHTPGPLRMRLNVCV